MNDEELQHRLRRIDPTDGTSIDPVHGPRAAALMEQIVNTPHFPQHDEVVATVRAPKRRSRFLLGGAAAVALLGGGAFAVATSGGGTSAETSVEYSLGAFDPLTTMCLVVADQVPAPGTLAFKGVVSEVGDTTVTLDVADWFGAGNADQVVLSLADAGSPALDGVEFAEGGEYLVAVTDGVVQTCGMSGPVSPELEALYAGWFGS